jgi:hypothetical protein
MIATSLLLFACFVKNCGCGSLPRRNPRRAGADRHPDPAAGRELWGFPKKLAQPTLRTESECPQCLERFAAERRPGSPSK